MKKANTIKILEAMDNWQELSSSQLSNLTTWRFSAYTHQLEKQGVRFQKTPWKSNTLIFKIIYIPKNLIYKWRNSIKVIKEKTLIQKFKQLFS